MQLLLFVGQRIQVYSGNALFIAVLDTRVEYGDTYYSFNIQNDTGEADLYFSDRSISRVQITDYLPVVFLK